MQAVVQEQQGRGQEATAALSDAYASIDSMEAQLNKLLQKMKKAAVDIHVAINPNHQGRLCDTVAALLPWTAPLSASAVTPHLAPSPS